MGGGGSSPSRARTVIHVTDSSPLPSVLAVYVAKKPPTNSLSANPSTRGGRGVGGGEDAGETRIVPPFPPRARGSLRQSR